MIKEGKTRMGVIFPDPVDLEKICHKPDTCTELHNETEHHYGCECAACMMEYWLLKH